MAKTRISVIVIALWSSIVVLAQAPAVNIPELMAGVYFPSAVAVDSEGNLFIADINKSRIRKVSATGTASVVAGTGVAGYSGDAGPATAAQLNHPNGVAVDAEGNSILKFRVTFFANPLLKGEGGPRQRAG
jgi:hypothetical protein